MQLHEAITAFRATEALVEAREPRKLRAPNLPHALDWERRGAQWDALDRDPYDRWLLPSKGEWTGPAPDFVARQRAVDRESPGPSQAVKDFRARKAREKAAAAAKKSAVVRQAAKERKTASRERRLKAQGLPLDYSRRSEAPAKSKPDNIRVWRAPEK